MSTIIYARVSTADQDLTHQRDRLWDHAVEELGVGPDEIDVIEDRSTGTDIDRSGYRELMERVEAGDADQVVVRSVSRVARNMRDLQNTVGEILDGGAGLHFVTDGLALNPSPEGDENGMDTRDKILLNVLGLAAELEADLLRERTLDGLRAAEQAGKHVGRPPYGFKTDEEGYLIPNEDLPTRTRGDRSGRGTGLEHAQDRPTHGSLTTDGRQNSRPAGSLSRSHSIGRRLSEPSVTWLDGRFCSGSTCSTSRGG